ncbi:nucleotidyltransferase domain-containing protein [Candidatus Bathyarchaeota archaeon]|nr:nucleotidyltransferase domain-containing protein [Candidatus Bathyarchaeota archaeon]
MKIKDLNALKDKIAEIALENSFIAGVLLFGSIARKERDEESDIDLLILWENLNVEDIYLHIYKTFSKYFPHENLTILDMDYSSFFNVKKASSLYLNIIYDAIILYDKYGKLLNFILKVKNELRAKGIKRKKIGKYYFWKLPKPGQKIELKI